MKKPVSSKFERPALSIIQRYILYATGKVILIVFGILIALQINNWNENRKDRHTEAQTLRALLENMEEDSQNLERVIERFELSLANIQRLFMQAPIPDDSLAGWPGKSNVIGKFICLIL